jgi:hypothetical protein
MRLQSAFAPSNPWPVDGAHFPQQQKGINMEPTFASQTFDIAIKDGRPSITRSYTFKNGDTISFAVTLQKDYDATLSDMHRRSVETAINHLKTLIPQQ